MAKFELTFSDIQTFRPGKRLVNTSFIYFFKQLTLWVVVMIKCALSRDIVLKVEKVWESVPKPEKVWESLP